MNGRVISEFQGSLKVTTWTYNMDEEWLNWVVDDPSIQLGNKGRSENIIYLPEEHWLRARVLVIISRLASTGQLSYFGVLVDVNLTVAGWLSRMSSLDLNAGHINRLTR
jgi:hypothetical protein